MRISRLIFYSTLIIFPFGQLASFYFSFGQTFFRVPLIDVGCFILCFYWLFFQKKSKPPFFFKSLALFGMVAGVSLAFKAPLLPLGELLRAFFYLIRLYTWICFFWAFNDFFRKESPPLINLLVCEGVIVACCSLAQFFWLPDTRFLYYSGWDDHLFRAMGTFLDPAFNGLILVLSFIATTKKIFNKNSWGNKIILAVILFLLIACIVLTFSRMSYLLLFISSTIIFIFNKKWKYFLFLACIFSLLVFLTPKPYGEGVDLLRTRTNFAKYDNYRQIFEIVKDNLLLGIGYNTLRLEAFKRGFVAAENWQVSHSAAGADNSFLFVLATTGIFGLISYLCFWKKILQKAVAEKEIYFLAVNITLIVSSFFINSLFYPWILYWLGLYLADFTAEIEE